MVNWNDPETLQREGVILIGVIHFVSGIYAWETALQIYSFEWAIISRKRHFRWPMLVYFGCRYFMLFSLLGSLIIFNAKQQLNCQALFTFTQFAGNSAIGFASSLLMLRTIAVWNRNLWVTVPLITVNLGQWAILLHGVTTIVSSWVPQAGTCVVTHSGTLSFGLIYFYTMCFDLLVLVLTVWGLSLSPGRSNLWKLLFTDGAIYFALAFISNIFPAVFIALNLSTVMNLMFSAPAACVACVVSCRSFIRLSTFRISDNHVHAGRTGWVSSTQLGTIKNTKGLRVNHVSDVDSSTGKTSDAMVRSEGLGAPDTASGVRVLVETFSQTVEDGKPQDGLYDARQQTQAWEGRNGRGFSSDV